MTQKNRESDFKKRLDELLSRDPEDFWIPAKEALHLGMAGTDMSGSMRGENEIFGHEVAHKIPMKNYPTGTGKTYISKEISKIFNDKIIRIDASDYKDTKNLDKLLGAPPGYQGYSGNENKLKLTPEQEKSLAETFAGIRRDREMSDSRRNGEELAAACHDGVGAATPAMKPLRFRGSTGATFAVAGSAWS